MITAVVVTIPLLLLLILLTMLMPKVMRTLIGVIVGGIAFIVMGLWLIGHLRESDGPTSIPSKMVLDTPVQAASADRVPHSVPPVATVAASPREAKWDEANPPPDWPKFTVIPGKPKPKPRSPDQALSTALNIEKRWADYRSGKTKKPVTLVENGNAIEGLVMIKSTSPQYPQAWAAFVRLRKLDREIVGTER
jgi:hypothetical protein